MANARSKKPVSLLDRVSNAVGGGTSFEVCQKAVAAALPELVKASGRLNLEHVCRTHGIRIDRVPDAPFEGRFEWIRNRLPVITLRTVDTKGEHRQRFTIAHELGHWIVQELLKERKAQLFRGIPFRSTEADEEERLADLLASEILMPRDRVLGFRSDRITHQTIDDGLKMFDVSRSAFVRRYAEVLKCEVLQLTVVPELFKKAESKATVDDAWHSKHNGEFIRRQFDVTFCSAPSFLSLATSTFTELQMSLRGRVEAWGFDCRAVFGMVPRVHLVGSKL
jgi:Zn-dependent peptidase ImmA (M78 family)